MFDDGSLQYEPTTTRGDTGFWTLKCGSMIVTVNYNYCYCTYIYTYIHHNIDMIIEHIVCTYLYIYIHILYFCILYSPLGGGLWSVGQFGYTALYWAANHGLLELCKLLREKGADAWSQCVAEDWELRIVVGDSWTRPDHKYVFNRAVKIHKVTFLCTKTCAFLQDCRAASTFVARVWKACCMIPIGAPMVQSFWDWSSLSPLSYTNVLYYWSSPFRCMYLYTVSNWFLKIPVTVNITNNLHF